MAGKNYRSKLYLENRRIILESKPMCVYCRTRHATTVDHVIEVDRGGGHGLDNLVPACQRCNSKKGAAYGNAKTRARTLERAMAVRQGTEPLPTPPEQGFLVSTPDPGRPSSVNPPEKRAGQKKTGGAEPKATEGGLIAPRLETPLRGLQSHGPEVARWARDMMKIKLMPWQVHALNGLLEYETPGFPCHRLGLVSVARQNGKSTAMAALLGWWLTEAHKYRGGPQTIISTAHTLDLAVSLFQQLAPVLEQSYGAVAKWSYGRNEVTMPAEFGASTWMVRAASPSAGHGRSVDLVIIDEVFDVSDDVIDNGLLPAQRARKAPLCSMWSTAGTQASVAMQRFRTEGLQTIQDGTPGRLYLGEWSVPPEANVADPTNWPMANPAIGYTLDLDTLRQEWQGPNRGAFLRASLNMWVSSDKAWLEPGVWDGLTDQVDPPAPAVLAFDVSLDGQRYSGVTAHQLDDGRTYVRQAFTVASEVDGWAQVSKIMADSPTCLLAVPPSLQIHVPPLLERRHTTVGYGEIVKWTAMVRSMILEGRVCHPDDVLLGEHMARAVAAKTASGWALTSQKSPGPIELARLCVFATALASKPTNKARPALAFSRR